MACAITEQTLIQESGRIATDFINLDVPTSPTLTLSMDNQEDFPQEMGDEVNVWLPRRSYTDKPEWTSVAANGPVTSDNGTCAPAGETVNSAALLKTFGLKQIALNSQKFCLEDLRFPWKVKMQLGAITTNLRENTKINWIYRFQDEFFRLATKVVVDTGLTTSTSEFWPTTEATGKLTQKVLDRLRYALTYAGGGKYSYAMSQGAPVYALLIDPFVSDQIIYENEAIRQDLRWAEPKELLKPLGVTRDYRGFFHLPEFWSIRANYVNGAYVPVLPYVLGPSVTEGQEWIPNPSYQSAGFAVTFIYTKGLLGNARPQRPPTAEGMTFKNYTYGGQFSWRNIPDEVCNPDENIGFWRARFMHGTIPRDTNLGYAIISKLCPYDNDLTGCDYDG